MCKIKLLAFLCTLLYYSIFIMHLVLAIVTMLYYYKMNTILCIALTHDVHPCMPSVVGSGSDDLSHQHQHYYLKIPVNKILINCTSVMNHKSS